MPRNTVVIFLFQIGDRLWRPPSLYLVVMPCNRRFSEELRRILKGYNIQAYFKPTNMLRQILVRPKDKLDKFQVTGPVYHIPCEDCSASYVGETERSLKACFMEHRQPSSSLSEVPILTHSRNGAGTLSRHHDRRDFGGRA